MLKKIFAPAHDSLWTSLALLILRVWLGMTMLINHGVGKLTSFSEKAPDFPDPLGVGHATSLLLVDGQATIAEDPNIGREIAGAVDRAGPGGAIRAREIRRRDQGRDPYWYR